MFKVIGVRGVSHVKVMTRGGGEGRQPCSR